MPYCCFLDIYNCFQLLYIVFLHISAHPSSLHSCSLSIPPLLSSSLLLSPSSSPLYHPPLFPPLLSITLFSTLLCHPFFPPLLSITLFSTLLRYPLLPSLSSPSSSSSPSSPFHHPLLLPPLLSVTLFFSLLSSPSPSSPSSSPLHHPLLLPPLLLCQATARYRGNGPQSTCRCWIQVRVTNRLHSGVSGCV